jgi:O-succinylbenzoic acid--CoA ligase
MDRAELAARLGAPAAVGESDPAPRVIAESEPTQFRASFAAAVAAGGEVFLADPNWSDTQRGELETLLRARVPESNGARNGRGWLCIPSGGTSGQLKFARHDEETIAAAVRGFAQHFGLQRVNAVSVLPMHHVSGLMAWVRCALTGGECVSFDWKRLERGERPEQRIDARWSISLVPTQLQRLLRDTAAVEWLRRFGLIFVGGGPVWPALADQAAAAGLRVSLSYGMTETAAMVAAQQPEEFVVGRRDAGHALPHATVRLDLERRIVVGGPSLFRGYYPEFAAITEFVTEDVGEIDPQGRLHVLGRRDAMILSGGKKLSPVDIEAVLRSSGEFDDVVVLGEPDAEWGEIAVACYPAGRVPKLSRALRDLAGWQRPKRFVAVEPWPRNAQGKVNRAALREAVRSSAR